MSEENSILVYVGDIETRSGRIFEELKIDELVTNINQFLSKIDLVLKNTPEHYGNFRFDEISLSAEISASGKLVLLGSGVEAATKGALVFRFKRIDNE